MSFSLNCTAANKADAELIVEQETLPDSVKAFLKASISAMADTPIYIKASGHLATSSQSNPVSSAVIEVQPMTFRKPASAASPVVTETLETAVAEPATDVGGGDIAA